MDKEIFIIRPKLGNATRKALLWSLIFRIFICEAVFTHFDREYAVQES